MKLKNTTIKNLIKIVLILIAILTFFILGFYKGISMNPNQNYNRMNSTEGEYWCEVYDDGTTIIHTTQEYLTNDETGNLLIINKSEDKE